MTTISDKLLSLKRSLPNQVILVAVSKTKTNSVIIEAYKSGQRIFGENRVQELLKKHKELPDDIKWHMIGHLQTKKVKLIAPFVDLIHSVDSLKLLKEINKRAIENNRKIDCLLQIHIAKESTKFGFRINAVKDILSVSSELNNVNIIGLMGMATFTDNKNQIKNEFKIIKKLFDVHKDNRIIHLSIGMSSDYLLAIEEGSTMIRIGSSIFGKRN